MNQRLWLHIGFWLAYLLLPSYVTADLGNASYKDFSWAYRLWKALLPELMVLPIKMTAFYWLFYRLLPAVQQQWKVQHIPQVIGLVLGSVLLYRLIVGYVVYPVVYETEYSGNPFSLSRQLLSFTDIYSIVGIAGAIHLLRQRQRQKEREQQLIREKLESELHFLRAQINPHFFFNTLNNIYGLARKQSKDTAEVVMRLSKLMRFMLYECSGASIPLSREVKIMEDYIELEKLRYDDRLRVESHCQMDNPEQAIAPLLLLPFVENAFKHGASELRKDGWIRMQLILQNQQLQFRISNNHHGEPAENAKGLGLKNVRRQLELLYPQRHQLQVEKTDTAFTVDLTIQLSEV